MKRVTCTLYSTWCIMICLVIPILSLLLFYTIPNRLYSLSKLSFTCYILVYNDLILQVNEKICNLEREYRDCIKSRRDKIGITRHIMMHQVCMSPSSLGNCTIYSTWCIMICLVIPILSLLLFIQSLYSLSKLQIFSFTCLLSFFCCF